MTPIATSRRLERLLRLAPRRLERAALDQLRLRPIPATVSEDRVRRVGAVFEAAAVLARRASAPDSLVYRAQRASAASIDRGTSRLLDEETDVVTAYWGAALRSFRRARDLGIRTFLDYPIAHHRFAEEMLAEEAQLVPEYAGTLQFHDLPRRLREQIELEIELADRVLMLSSFQRRTFERAGVSESKLVTVNLGVDSEMFTPARDPGAEGSGFKVLFGGQVSQRKGVSYLVEAFRAAALPRSELVLLGSVVGDRPWAGEAGVRHVPPVPLPELPSLYRACDVFVLPSLVEAFPMMALQAMACGLPTIVSENTFGSDVITDGVDGFVVPIRDPASIADRLVRLHDDPDYRAQMGAAARARAEQLSWKRYGEEIVTALRGLTR